MGRSFNGYKSKPRSILIWRFFCQNNCAKIKMETSDKQKNVVKFALVRKCALLIFFPITVIQSETGILLTSCFIFESGDCIMSIDGSPLAGFTFEEVSWLVSACRPVSLCLYVCLCVGLSSWLTSCFLLGLSTWQNRSHTSSSPYLMIHSWLFAMHHTYRNSVSPCWNGVPSFLPSMNERA